MRRRATLTEVALTPLILQLAAADYRSDAAAVATIQARIIALDGDLRLAQAIAAQLVLSTLAALHQETQ